MLIFEANFEKKIPVSDFCFLFNILSRILRRSRMELILEGTGKRVVVEEERGRREGERERELT